MDHTWKTFISCIEQGVKYTGRNVTKNHVRPYLLSSSSEINLLANSTQKRLGFRYTTLLINCHRHTNGENAVRKSTVNLSFRRLQPKINKFRKFKKERRMRVSGKRQGIDKWSNGWSCSTEFQTRKSKWEIKWKYVNKDNSLTNFTFSILFVIYKREEVEIRHEPSWYEK